MRQEQWAQSNAKPPPMAAMITTAQQPPPPPQSSPHQPSQPSPPPLQPSPALPQLQPPPPPLLEALPALRPEATDLRLEATDLHAGDVKTVAETWAEVRADVAAEVVAEVATADAIDAGSHPSMPQPPTLQPTPPRSDELGSVDGAARVRPLAGRNPIIRTANPAPPAADPPGAIVDCAQCINPIAYPPAVFPGGHTTPPAVRRPSVSPHHCAVTASSLPFTSADPSQWDQPLNHAPEPGSEWPQWVGTRDEDFVEFHEDELIDELDPVGETLCTSANEVVCTHDSPPSGTPPRFH